MGGGLVLCCSSSLLMRLQIHVAFRGGGGEKGGGEGHIVFSADPVGVGVATCLHSILIEWTGFGQTYTNISLGGGKMLIRFGYLDPIFKVTGGLRLLENWA